MNTEYRGYILTIDEGTVIAIELNGEELGDGGWDRCNLQDAIEWINEDIGCRKDEEEERVYLTLGDTVFCDDTIGHVGPDTGVEGENVIKFDKWGEDAIFYHDGLEVQFDKNKKAYILP